jgi:hypothetical protein
MPTRLVHAKEKATLMTTSECNTSEKNRWDEIQNTKFLEALRICCLRACANTRNFRPLK